MKRARLAASPFHIHDASNRVVSRAKCYAAFSFSVDDAAAEVEDVFG